MWDNLKASIASVVRTNNNQEITGANLQNVLNTIVNTVGANATFAGIAVPSTNPGSPDGPVFYIACEPGVYSNFNLTLVDGLYILENKTGSWVGTQINTGAAFEALIGYYNAVLNGASITVPEATTYRLTKGGVIRLKMLAPGTTATTLTIGNATNIPIWYNGAAVSEQNTWEANEIISVFYDGTRFMASNSQGGGGKAEKILYNNSQSGLSAENVQDALDEVGNAIYEQSEAKVIPAGTSTKNYYTYQDGVINVGSSSNFRCWAPIDISECYALQIQFYIPDNPNPAAAKTFFTDENDMMVGDFLVNTSGDYLTYIVPKGAKKLYWSTNYNKQKAVGLRGITRVNKLDEKSDKKEISILFIGNSLTQDVVSYVPLLLRELAPDLNFKLYDWYNGGFTLSQQLAYFNNNTPCAIFSRCENGTSWENFNKSVTMESVLSTYKFDIVSIQEYFNYQETADVDVFNSVVEYIENHYSHPFKVVTLFHQPIRDNADEVFARTKAGNALFLKETVAEDMIPSGIAIYRAMQTALDSLGDKEHLSSDGIHAQEGLPCMMQAYVTAMWILKQVGVPMSVNNASSVVDDSNYASINVPGPNLGTGVVVGTPEQVRLSQKVAVEAFREGEYLVNANLQAENIEYDNSASGLAATDVQGAVDEIKDMSVRSKPLSLLEYTGTSSLGDAERLQINADGTITTSTSSNKSNYHVRWFKGICTKGDYIEFEGTPTLGRTVRIGFVEDNPDEMTGAELLATVVGNISELSITANTTGRIRVKVPYDGYLMYFLVAGSGVWQGPTWTIYRANIVYSVQNNLEEDSEYPISASAVIGAIYGKAGETLTSNIVLEQGGLDAYGAKQPNSHALYTTRARTANFFRVYGEFQFSVTEGYLWNCFYYSSNSAATVKRQTGVWSSGVCSDNFSGYIMINIRKEDNTDFTPDEVTVTIEYTTRVKGLYDDVEEIKNRLEDTGSYVYGADMIKKCVRTEYLGNLKYPQSFCIYDGKYYSTDGNNICEQNANFDIIRDIPLSLGHANALQLGENGVAWASGWNDNKIYKVNLIDLETIEVINLPQLGYFTAVVDEPNGIAYIFHRSTYPTTVDRYSFTIYDYINSEIKSTKKIERFMAMQSADLFEGKIYMLYGSKTAGTQGMKVYNTVGNIIASYNLSIFAGVEPEGIGINRDTMELCVSTYNSSTKNYSIYMVSNR